MKNISILQIIILVILIMLLITDFSKTKQKIINLLKNVNNINKKKGS